MGCQSVLQSCSSIHWRRRNPAAEAGTTQQRLLLGLCAGGTTFLLGPDVPFCPGPCWEVKQRVLMLAGRALLETGLKEVGFLLPPVFWVHQGDGPAGASTGGIGTSDGGDLSSPASFSDQEPPSCKQGFNQPPTSPGLSGSHSATSAVPGPPAGAGGPAQRSSCFPLGNVPPGSWGDAASRSLRREDCA